MIFEAPVEDARALEQQIEAHLRQALGYAVATFIRTPAELATVAAHHPFPSAHPDNTTLYIGFLPASPRDDALPEATGATNPVGRVPSAWPRAILALPHIDQPVGGQRGEDGARVGHADDAAQCDDREKARSKVRCAMTPSTATH
ncbi:MAG: DUF1697 domain-containing protein [Anaerolineae bacterium]